MYKSENTSLFSVHTLELRRQCTSNEYRSIRDTIKSFYINNRLRYHVRNNVNNSCKEEHVFLGFDNFKGITILPTVVILKEVPVYYGIYITINPRRFLVDDTLVKILDPDDVYDFLDKIDKLFYILNIDNIISFNDFKLHRVDMCNNLYLGNQYLVEKYVELAKRCRVPNGYKVNNYNKNSYPIRELKNGVKMSNNSVGIVIYNKKAQMEDQGFDSDSDDANGVLRVEVQLYRNKLDREFRDSYKNKNLYNFFYNIEVESKNYFESYIPKMFSKGDYLTLHLAREVVNTSNYSPKIKDRMLMILESVSTHRSLEKGLEEVYNESGLSNKYNFYYRMIKYFDDIYLNPVTIPTRWFDSNEYILSGIYNLLMDIIVVFF